MNEYATLTGVLRSVTIFHGTAQHSTGCESWLGDSGMASFVSSESVASAPNMMGVRAYRPYNVCRVMGAAMTRDRIEINPEVMLGKPVIRGTRIPVELILRKLSEGATEADLLDAYPRLTRSDIQAALAYAADTVAHETILLQTP
jgi:uncharacterized protein (DUF433 family)